MQTKLKFYLIFSSAIVFSLCYNQCLALEKAAMVVAVRGIVTASDSSGVERRLKSKGDIYQEDTINTGEQGRLQMLFSDGTLISLGRKTEMLVSEYKWNAVQKNGALKTKVNEGTFRVMGGAITNFSPKKFTTETPTATIGIRGSSYTGAVLPIPSSGPTVTYSLSVYFQAGKGIDITNAAGTVGITTPGVGTRVFSHALPPLEPFKFAPSDIADIDHDLIGIAEDKSPPKKTEEKKETPSEKVKNKKLKKEKQDGGEAKDKRERKPAPKEDKPGDKPEKTGQNNDAPAREDKGPGHAQEPGQQPGGDPAKFNNGPDQQLNSPNFPDGDPNAMAGENNFHGGDPNLLPGENNYPGGDPNLMPGENNFPGGDPNLMPGENNFPGGDPNLMPGENNFPGGDPNLMPGENNFPGGDPNLMPGENNFSGGDPNFQEGYQYFPGENLNLQQGDQNFQTGSPNFNIGDPNFQDGEPNFYSGTPTGPDSTPNIFYGDQIIPDGDQYSNVVPPPPVYINPDYTAPVTQPINDPFFNPIDHVFDSGKFWEVWDTDSLASPGTDDRWILGDFINVTSKNGVIEGIVSGNLITASGITTNSANFSFIQALQPYSPNAVYSGINNLKMNLNIVQPDNSSIPSTRNYYWGNKGEFAYFSTIGSSNGINLYAELGFAGINTLTGNLKTNGITYYNGTVLHVLQDGISTTSRNKETSLDKLYMAANWHNNKVFGVVLDAKTTSAYSEPPHAFIFGTMSGTDITNVQVSSPLEIYSDLNTTTPDPNIFTGSYGNTSGTIGHLYGSEAQAFGFGMSGQDFQFTTGNIVNSWKAIGVGLQKKYISPPSPLPATSSTWNGYVAGLAINIQDKKTMRLYMNTDPADFTFSLNRDTGVLSSPGPGTLTAADYWNTALNTHLNNKIQSLQINSSQSYYVSDHALGAFFNNSSTVINQGGTTGPLLNAGSFQNSNFLAAAAPQKDPTLISPDEKEQFADYATWGYWQIAYDEPGTSTNIFAAPSSYFIAGQKTDPSTISSMIGASYKATYIGGAQGTRIDNPTGTPTFYNLDNGVSNITVDFAAGSPQVTGNIQFPGKTGIFDAVKLDMSSSLISGTSSFTGTITGAGYYNGINFTGATAPTTPTSSNINGSLYGSQAESIGGNFDVNIPALDNTPAGGNNNQAARVFGIFGGDR